MCSAHHANMQQHACISGSLSQKKQEAQPPAFFVFQILSVIFYFTVIFVIRIALKLLSFLKRIIIDHLPDVEAESP